jgi:hypothetical protein
MYETLQHLKPVTRRVDYVCSQNLFVNFGNSVQQTACNSSNFNGGKSLVFSTPKKHIPCSDEDIENWVSFMNECGFPCSVETKKDTIDISINREDYISFSHWKCGVTAIRYPIYGRSTDFIKVVEDSISYFLNEKLTPHECLCKAHNFSYFDTGHGLAAKAKVFTKEEMLEKVTKNPDIRINSIYE